MKLVLLFGAALGMFAGWGVAAGPPQIKKLPAHILAPPGKLSLFADFKKGKPDVVIYLVNRTGKTIDVVTHKGQPFLPLEYEAAPGRWKLASVLDSPLCGNSLTIVKLPNDGYLTATGYNPNRGFKAKVRYRLEEGPVSNAGEGLVSHDDLTYLLLAKTTDFKLLSQVASGEFIPPTELADYRRLAIGRLFEMGAKAEPVLKRIAEGIDKTHAAHARALLASLRAAQKK
jgi:hypothetical protein